MPERVQDPERIKRLEVSRLLLDDHNFRFSEDIQGSNQKDLLKILDRDFELIPIGESLADNGYFVEEPLVVIPKPPNEHVVVEGNRRLAALKLILDKGLRSIAQNPSAWEALAERQKEDLHRVPTVTYESREQLTTVLGFRHIAGILKWDPLAKARFINGLVEGKGKEANFAKIARETGTRGNTIGANYIAYRIFLQARDAFEIDTSKLEKNFSIFYRALSNPSFTDFIGLKKDRSPTELRMPIPKKKANALEELIGYIHGTNKLTAVLTDSRQLTRLGEILSSTPAYEYLKNHRSLDQAYQLTGGEERRLMNNLKKASLYLDEALRDAHRHKASTRVTLLVERCTETMLEILRSFPGIKRKLENRR